MGIDHGNSITGYGVIHFNPDTNDILYIDHGYIYDSKVKYPVSLSYMGGFLKSIIYRHSPSVAVVEAPKHTRGFKSYQKQVELLGCIKGLLVASHTRFVEMPPSTMKRLVAGHGYASKEEVARVISDRFELPIHQLAHVEYYKSGQKQGEVKSYSWDGTDALGLALAFPSYIREGKGLDYKGFVKED